MLVPGLINSVEIGGRFMVRVVSSVTASTVTVAASVSA